MTVLFHALAEKKLSHSALESLPLELKPLELELESLQSLGSGAGSAVAVRSARETNLRPRIWSSDVQGCSGGMGAWPAGVNVAWPSS